MPKQGDKVAGSDVRGGLEFVAVLTKNGKDIANYRPSFVVDKTFHEVAGADVPKQVFMFFRQGGGAGRVY